MRVAALVLFGFLLFPGALPAKPAADDPGSTAPEHRTPRFMLVRTPLAPALASGFAEFGGPAAGVTTLSVKVQHLGPGIYWLRLIRKSDGANVTLAPLSVSDPDRAPDTRAGDTRNQRSSAYQATLLETQALVGLPSSLDLADIARLLVEDAEGNSLLTGNPVRP